MTNKPSHQDKLREELETFSRTANVHALPEIHQYWLDTYIAPMMKDLGISSHLDFYCTNIEASFTDDHASNHVISLGAGDCEVEAQIVEELISRGHQNFRFTCLELNESVIERGRARAKESGLEQHMTFAVANINDWQEASSYSSVIAHHSLHHFVELERIFDQVKAALKPNGKFITIDMIGRNGHLRWPKSLQLVQQYWHELPLSYRFNLQLQRYEEMFSDWDCSTEGFEGIRSQDILPLLLERFYFEQFVAFGDVVMPFVDRSFGHHFDLTTQWDREFIGRLHHLDENGFKSKELTPNIMFACMSPTESSKREYARGLAPEHCVRHP